MKKRLGALLATILLLTMLSVSVFAASSYVEIFASQSAAESATLRGPSGTFTGYNRLWSERKLQFIAKYSNGGIWRQDTKVTISAGASFANEKTSIRESTTNWKLRLDPDGSIYGGCGGYGTIYV